MTEQAVVVLLVGIALLLLGARLMGEAARAIGLPTVVGEIFAGILLGQTIAGRLAPQTWAAVFPAEGEARIALFGFLIICVCLLLLSAGLETELDVIVRQGRAAILIGIASLAFPFTVASCLALAHPQFLGIAPGVSPLLFAVVVGVMLSITALPVISKILLDLDLLKSDLGTLIVAAAMLNDLVGWLLFSVLLTLMPNRGLPPATTADLAGTVAMTLALTIGAMTVLRWAARLTLPWVERHLSWPSGVLTVTLATGLLMAAAAEAIGIHAVFGAFLAGAALGSSHDLGQRTREIIHGFVGALFAPVFLAAIALRVDFAGDFNFSLTAAVLGIVVVGNWSGCILAARLAGLTWREGRAIAAAMCVGGAMEIILAGLAFRAGVVRTDLFVAVVITALTTSLASGPLIRLALRTRPGEPPIDILAMLRPELYCHDLATTDRREAIAQLVERAAPAVGLPAAEILDAVLARESLMGTAVGDGLAVPHARLQALSSPLLVIGRSTKGIDFDAADGQPVRIVFLLLTPEPQRQLQARLIAQFARVVHDPRRRIRLDEAPTFEDFIAVFKPDASS